MGQSHTHYRSYTFCSGTVLRRVGEHVLQPPLRTTTPTHTLYLVALKKMS